MKSKKYLYLVALLTLVIFFYYNNSLFEKTILDLYDPEKMPKGLLNLHQEIDIIVEKCYQSKPFLNDEEKLKCLFNMYADKLPESERLL